MSGLGTERAAGDNGRLAITNGMLVERGFGQIPVNRGEIFEAEFIGAVRAVPRTRFLHSIPPPPRRLCLA